VNAQRLWLIERCTRRARFGKGDAIKLRVKSSTLERGVCQSVFVQAISGRTFSILTLGVSMAMQRRRFRIEELQFDHSALPEDMADVGTAMGGEIMNELRAIRSMLENGAGASAPVEAIDNALVQSYREQIEQYGQLKIELDLIQSAIERTKQEIATLHSKGFEGSQMTVVSDELGAVVSGTEQATQSILEAAEEIDQAAAALASTNSEDQRRQLAQEVQERVVGIFEACNFQDLTGQRITKVVNTMKFIEEHINVMMDIWGGVETIRTHMPMTVEDECERKKYINGPRLDDAEGHISQNDIDALFN